jgi:hypothetical protein
MSRKRPSIVDALDLAAGDDEPPPLEAASGVAAPPSPPAAKPKLRPEVQHTSIYVPKAAYRKIRDIANTQDRKPHDVIMEGIDLVLGKYGFPSVAELKERKG